MIDLNVRALTDLSLRWIDSLTRHRGGILNVASIAAFLPGPAWPSITPPRPTCSRSARRCTPSWRRRACASPRCAPARCETEFIGTRRHPARLFPALSRPHAPSGSAREGYDGFMRRQARGGAGDAEQGRDAAAAAVAAAHCAGDDRARWRRWIVAPA